MDKYEYKVRADEIKQLIACGEYAQAAEIADTIDWRRVKSVMMLCTISDLYKINRRYEDARDMLLLAYERRPGGRTICYSLCELSIKMEEYVQAVEYYKEFVQVAPKDSGRYVLQYKLYEAQDVSLEERIEVLEELKKRDYREKWAYELAYLYHRIGLATRCVEECDEMILWFGEGKYVIKALELKKLHQPLTPEQQQKYDNRFRATEETQNEQVPTKMPVKESVDEPVSPAAEQEQVTGDTKVFGELPAELDIHVKTMDVGEYNTINLQAELAEGLKEVLGEESIENPITRSIVAPMLESDTESLDYPQIDEVSEDDLEPEAEEIAEAEVFFGETEELGGMQEIIWTAEPPKELASVLSQESDGQLSLVMPEAENIEKQITGQMSIEDILVEWERMKKENEEKRKEEVRRHVLQQTGTMFTDFEASVRDGLLEQLESGRIDSEETAEDLSEETAEEVAEDFSEEALEEVSEEVAEEASEEISEEALEEASEEISEEALEEVTEEIPEEAAEEASEELGEDETEDIVWDVQESAEEIEEEPVAEFAEEPEPEAETVEEPEVVRDKAQIRALTREERELFAPFIQSRRAKEQLAQAIDNISMAAYTGNIIITGEEGMDVLTLAKNIIREVQMEDSNFSGKVAKISGNALNKKDVSAIVGDLKNGALIIQKPSEMDSKTAGSLNKTLQQENMGIIVVMVDTKRAMNRFLMQYRDLEDCFTSRMDVEALSNDSLVAFGRQYAREREYAVDELGVLALHTRIEELQTSDHIVTVMEVKEIVDEAIRHANRKTIGHFFDVLLAKRYDDEDMIILGEKDFC